MMVSLGTGGGTAGRSFCVGETDSFGGDVVGMATTHQAGERKSFGMGLSHMDVIGVVMGVTVGLRSCHTRFSQRPQLNKKTLNPSAHAFLFIHLS
jgi:hypothetical protein